MNNTKEQIKPSFVYNEQEYYNRTLAAEYVGVPDVSLRRRMKLIEDANGIIFPLAVMPISLHRNTQEVCINRKILDLLKKPVSRGREGEWFKKLKETILEVETDLV